ncbi:hypothetical protein VPNG_09026 [Cytospora leucostoma]|uniref:Uncharacterized protein n=1 Tax=Cytospora leucostoma TaxID=1230097 RepID=A0A423VZT1_9PEZI|nr:hypothetical protein VPNG_09026 [Cytospora leucostoma]
MLIPETTSALIAAFSFGIVVNAASAALFLNVRGYGSSIFLDGKRLALIIFLLSAALWAQLDFITILIGPIGARACQIGVIFTTIFDQLARYAIEQHLLWVINAGTGAGVGQYAPQGLLAGRFILGAVYIGFSRHQMDTICAPISSISAIAIAVVAVDAAIVAILGVRAVSVGLLMMIKKGSQDSARGHAIIAMLIGLVIWMATSVVMLLGFSTTDYLFRSTVPAGGLVILIIIVTTGSGVLLDTRPRDRKRSMLESPSPFSNATARFITPSRPGEYPPSRYEDLKTQQMTSSTAFVQPREVPLPGQGLLNMPGPMGGQDVGGVPIQGQLFPPMRSSTAPAITIKGRPQEKSKSFFKARGKSERAITVGKLAISNPVLLEGGANPLDKVATVDLKTAARQEMERRARAANPHLSTYRYQDTMAVSSRAEGIEWTTASTTSREAVAGTPEPALSKDETLAIGSATGSQLSPSGEDIRRRSPRHAPSTSREPAQSEVVSTQIRIPTRPIQSGSISRGLPQNQYGIDNTNIPRSPSLSPSSKTSTTEPAKLPLPGRPTNGLPGNPRAPSVRRPPGNSEKSRQETIMFVNEIVYDDPSSVANAIDGAKEQGPKPLAQAPIKMATPTTPPVSTNFPETSSSPVSVVNRPRPVPRRSNTLGMDAYFPGHRRTKSAGVLGQRRYMLQSHLGSPTPVPPLPLPPQSPIRAARPKPNDTKSMTYDEKMVLLFPRTEGTAGKRRRSSVPTLPKTPMSFMGNSPTPTANDERDTTLWSSKEATPVQTRSLFEEQEPEQAPHPQVAMGIPDRQLSGVAYHTIVDVTNRQPMLPGSPKETRPSEEITKEGKRACRSSSPVLPPRMSIMSATTMDDATVDWDINNSPAPVHQVGLEVHKDRATQYGSSGLRAISAMTNQSGEIGIMLDTSVARDIAPEFQQATPVEVDSPATDAMSRYSSGQWHRRIGDETLRFSSRSGRSRRSTPPAQLVFSDRPKPAKQAILGQAVETSPLPSPELSLQMIQAQLKKYEQPFRDSTESPGQGRLALLHDLEQEMGQQETRWATMQQDLHATRDSLSTLDFMSAVGSRRTSRNVLAVESILAEPDYQFGSSYPLSSADIRADRSESRRERMESSSSSGSSSLDMTRGSRANIWQRRLKEAQEEYLEYAKELPSKRSTNLFSVSKADLGSPTPPDSDGYETEDETWRDIPALLETQAKQRAAAKLLWTAPQAPENRTGMLWVKPEKPHKQQNPSQRPPLPSLSVRPARRKDNTTMFIDSTDLWKKPTPNAASSTSGLWRSPFELQGLTESAKPPPTPEAQAPTHYNPSIQGSRTTTGARPLTQRPPRRSKRITTLPDILEDPQPLPDKRGTLGIYQFPWGERSDVAYVQPRPQMFMPMPGTMSTQGFAVPPVLGSNTDQRELDEFSMFPPPASAAAYTETDQNTEEAQDYEESVARQNILVSMEEPDGLQEMPSPMPPSRSLKRTQSTLWQVTRDTEEALTRNGDGLSQPEDWLVYDEMEEEKVGPRVSAQPTLIESDNLWMPPPPETDGSRSPMWAPQKIPESSTPASRKIFNEVETLLPVGEVSPEESATPKVVSPMAVWEAPTWKLEQQPRKGDHGVGLPQPQDWESYNDTSSTIRTKPRLSEPSVIESVHLWRSPSNEQTGPKHWLQSLRVTATSGLWQFEKSHSKGDHGIGLPQPHDWDSYKTVKTSGRAKPRLSEPAAITSMSLWDDRGPSETPGPRNWLQSSRASTTSTGLWHSERQQYRGEHGVGLPHPPPQVWERYDISEATIRAKPRRSQPAAVQSMNLWQPSRPSARSEPKHWLLQPGKMAIPSQLWQLSKQLQIGEHSLGLPHPEDWKDYDTVKSTIHAKPRKFEPTVIESTSLWQAPTTELAIKVTASPSKMWTPKTRSTPESRAVVSTQRMSSHIEQPSKMLWSAPSPKVVPRSEGLFDPKDGRSDLKTTSLAPAALHMNRKPRPVDTRPLKQLTSTTLWSSSDRKIKKEMNWISQMDSRKSVATSAPSTKGPYRRIVASDTEWEAALQQALAASYPRSPRRKAASPEEWKVALEQAIAASYPPRFDGKDLDPVLTPPTPASPEIYGLDEDDSAQDQEMDQVLYARIEALEKERLYAEQWATNSFAARY